ncbi:prephenate dehydrogenase [Urechidicola croceus]|uniref:Prephenate dehydrogenase n=1 Tax=Urechidicola croceus TaxID=1850246 RepID=A0A1D8P7J8_9FLAO|nr:prephenate dehydrogenase [Urechidicola croceus]AOW20557.1 prephenate dehydrogenase [Urechidicola croceus]
MEKIAVIGLGLIGGSLALDIKDAFGCRILGVDRPENAKKALEIGFIDEITTINKLTDVDVVIIATPVDTVVEIAAKVLDLIAEDTLVFDVGSVKEEICKMLGNHPKRKNFLAAHPIAGTEFSGPEAAIKDLFSKKVNILCELEKTDRKIANKAFEIFDSLGMEYKYMSATEHDRHIAYVSHLSHVSSFMLGKTVLEMERSEQNIFDMAGSGFESTVRLAKSSPNTWTPIFLHNKKNLISSLEQYIKNLIEFKEFVEQDNAKEIHNSMSDTNHLKEILKGINQKQQHNK